MTDADRDLDQRRRTDEAFQASLVWGRWFIAAYSAAIFFMAASFASVLLGNAGNGGVFALTAILPPCWLACAARCVRS